VGIVVQILLFIAVGTASGMLIITISQALRDREIPTGPPQVSFWRMMLLRVLCAAFFLFWIYVLPESNRMQDSGIHGLSSTGKAPAWAALFVVVADAIWAIVRSLVTIRK
jgi:hypothetical protein